MRPAAIKSSDLLLPTKTVLSDLHGVKVSITNGNGKTRRYQANSVIIQIVRGGIEILHDRLGSYAWFERCRLEARAGSKHLLLGLATGLVSSIGEKMTIIAAEESLAPPPAKIFAKQRVAEAGKDKRRHKAKSP